MNVSEAVDPCYECVDQVGVAVDTSTRSLASKNGTFDK